jgi:DNA (cytosine-5)-methyltransferase 1
MGFDRSYKLMHGSRRDKIKLLGNGVCPPVMQAIVTSLTGTQGEVEPPIIQSSPGRVGFIKDLMVA